MRISTNHAHLSYCTNIHPAHGWKNVSETLHRYVPALKQRHAPDQPFGIGLRLSGLESVQLLEGDALQQFRQYLDEQGLYVFTVNGFPYGDFHSQPVKEHVHTPDWREQERVDYTLRLIDILAHLLPEGMQGSISTSPLSYKRWIDMYDSDVWQLFTLHMIQIVDKLVKLRQERGIHIHLDIEPEPDGLIENSVELVKFYESCLLDTGADQLAKMLEISKEAARSHILDHIQVCFDTCHVAVAYEDPAEVLARYEAVGIKVGKIQISSALRIPLEDDFTQRFDMKQLLEQFSESTYLHQVLQRNDDGSITQYPDLPQALSHIYAPKAREWRVHFHVPIFIETYGGLFSTQETIHKTFDLLKDNAFCDHLEVETYTWDVLPGDLKLDLLESIDRELKWVRHVLS